MTTASKSTAAAESAALDKSLRRAFMRVMGPKLSELGLSSDRKKSLALDFANKVRQEIKETGKSRVATVRKKLTINRLALQFTQGILEGIKSMGDQKIVVIEVGNLGKVKIKHRGKQP